ncbi:MAG: squalene/phytoene synthase family protein, partial [Phycisphaeraceae bacterium]|nr:squalene/phytoene synthase family protein [Phycisphaeraceae bacterium]
MLSYDQAVRYTKNLTQSQYENFTVVSWFLPKPLKQDFHAVYSFCRWADDLGDEVGDPHKSIELLNWWRWELDACYAGSPKHPVYIALEPVIKKYDIPRKPFDDLIDAFVQDQTVNRYDSWDQVLDYCTRSANPVGRLVLYMSGYRDDEHQRLSDATCTALQLTNFWQDVRRDVLDRDRVYIPRDIARANGLSVDEMVDVIRADGKRRAEGDCCSTVACVPTIGVNAVLP